MLVYEEIWLEQQAPSEAPVLLVSMKPVSLKAVGPRFVAAMDEIGAVIFTYVSTVKGRSIYRASLLGPVSDQLLAGQDLEQLVWSGLLVNS